MHDIITTGVVHIVVNPTLHVDTNVSDVKSIERINKWSIRTDHLIANNHLNLNKETGYAQIAKHTITLDDVFVTRVDRLELMAMIDRTSTNEEIGCVRNARSKISLAVNPA